MIRDQILVIVAPTVARSVRRGIFHLGGLGFIPLGLLDSSVIPLPGSMDILTIVLSARKKELGLYYALMATIGSVIGGYVTYRLARKGGKETLERKFSARTLEKVYRIFGRWGFGAIALAALLPPPAPMVPFVFAAGAMQYSVGQFLVALTLGRVLRYSLLAFLAAHFGRHMLTTIMSQLGHPVLIAVIGLIAAAIAALVFIRLREHTKRAQTWPTSMPGVATIYPPTMQTREVRYSCRTTFSRELLTWISPLYSMKPNFLNLFMKKLTRGRVEPIISASISCDTLRSTF
jgi:membrane protein YqaA with SNARE-associated domain